MLAFKAVQQNYDPTAELIHLLTEFRSMVNHCTRIGIQKGITSVKALSLMTYKDLHAYDTMSYYKCSAISAAVGILRNHRKASRKGRLRNLPYCRRLRVTTYNGFKIANDFLLLPIRPREHLRIHLNKHTLQTISGHEVRSVTLTLHRLAIVFAKDVNEISPVGFIGIDRNLNNVTLALTNHEIQRINLTKAVEVKSIYRNIKSRLQRNDSRIRRRLNRKYGSKEHYKVQQILHHASKQIVQEAKRKRYGIALENITGLRRLYRRGNGRGSGYRFRMNSWSYGELQRQVEYKARWEGLPVVFVKPYGTSTICSRCGSRTTRIPEESRNVRCATCGLTMDRDVNAARNILARALRFRAVGLPVEAMVQEPDANPKQCAPVILKVDGSQLAYSTTS